MFKVESAGARHGPRQGWISPEIARARRGNVTQKPATKNLTEASTRLETRRQPPRSTYTYARRVNVDENDAH